VRQMKANPDFIQAFNLVKAEIAGARKSFSKDPAKKKHGTGKKARRDETVDGALEP